MKRTALAVLLFSIFTTSAHAATTVKMVGLKPTSTISLSQDPNDQVVSVLTTPTSIMVIGTSSGDGFITAYERTGMNTVWNLRLGGATDDIATAAVKDSAGDIWITGTSAIAPPTPTPTPLPTGTLNPSGVLPDTSTVLSAMTQLNIWKVSSKGVSLKNYSTVMSDVIYPDSISVKSGVATVSGAIASSNNGHFSISVKSDGTFSPPKISSVVSKAASDVKEVKTTLSLWRSFTTSVAIKGLPSWKPKPNSQVLVRYDSKTKAVVAAYLTSGEIVDFTWEKSIGIIALIHYPESYALTIIK